MNKVSLIKVNDYCKHLRCCSTLPKPEKQYTRNENLGFQLDVGTQMSNSFGKKASTSFWDI